MTDDPESRSALDDLRLVPVGSAAWAGSWLGTWASAASMGVGVGGALAIGAIAALRRSPLLAAMALVLLVTSGTGALQAHRLATGPIAGLVRTEAVVVAEVVTTADPRLHPAAGVRPPFVTIPATLTAVTGRGSSWRVQLPILVSVTGGEVEVWRDKPVGTRWRVQGRLQPADRGSDLVGILRVRGAAGAAAVVAPPSIGLVWVERVRAGLREAVAASCPGTAGARPCAGPRRHLGHHAHARS